MNEQRALVVTEVLVAMMLLAILFSIAYFRTDRGSPGRQAAALSRFVAGTRAQAVADGKTIGVSGPCAGRIWIELADVVAGSTVTWSRVGLVFTPDGLPRTCDGGGVGNTTILLEHRGRHAAVIVSSLGRVRWELR